MFYQVFNKDNTDNVNDKRFAAYIPIKNIINMYNMYNANANSRFSNKLVFTPTTIMELPNFSKYAFVINKVSFNSHKRIVLIVSTKEINIRNTSSSKKLIQIPCGKFKHVRFDVDDFNPFAVENDFVYGLWENIKSTCDASTTKSDTYDAINFNDGTVNGTVKLKLCDITMPTSPPKVCEGVSLNPIRTGPNIPYLNVDTKCFTNLTTMVDDNLLPEVFTYILTTANLGGSTCCKSGLVTPSFLFFNPTKIPTGDVINIYISQDNYKLDLSEYVVANSSYQQCDTCPMINVKQIYEISENTTNVTLNGSILTIKNKNIPGSCTLTVRQKYIHNLEISIKLQWN